MFHSVKIISVMIINMITLGILQNSVLALTTSSELPTSSLTSRYFSLSSLRGSKTSNISDSLLADNSAASLGREIDFKALSALSSPREAALYQYYTDSGIPLWKHLSDEQKYQFAQSICNYQGSGNLLFMIINRLGGNPYKDSIQGSAIMLASMHTLCPDRYRQEIRNAQDNLLNNF
ncbi:hypothetical protein [Planktothrix mougeotii]|uniref:DUF732 domain-containing protein n=1 Tax=Planktothrix mougeotii LEGE 06226 TaxID=1828728 RepID=A0ABR9UBF5_9CYAN|nr:hypothetical protein [Planktothrix mougeotii]MBE9143131.1 hypothetical protein [Planktothrix mougeotii LEGE 06226]